MIVDNVFATPLLQKPLKLGADIVVYSATKHIDGQGRCLGGVVLCSQKFLKDHLHTFLRQTGPALSPFNAWVLLKGLETLPLRVRAQCETAAKIADHLAAQPGLKVLYLRPPRPPAGGAGQAADVGLRHARDVRGRRAARRRPSASSMRCKLIKISNNLGDAKSLITHPATTTHQRLKPEARAELGISDGMLRLSVGLEAYADLTADIDRALAASRSG